MASYVRTAGCRVIIGGEGADEYFGGYSAYLNRHSPLCKYSPSPYTTYYESKYHFYEDDTTELLHTLEKIWAESLDAYSFVTNEYDRTTLAMMFCDAAYQLPSVGLRGADLMSTMWSVEPRSVFIRKPVIQYALNLPVKYKANNTLEGGPLFANKPVLKKLFKKYFSKKLIFEKQGFAGFPNESAFFLGDQMDYLTYSFLGINRESIIEGSRDRDSFWKLVNVEYFLREHCL
jgi:asparagine synthase (glutamine-hydrolysing)